MRVATDDKYTQERENIVGSIMRLNDRVKALEDQLKEKKRPPA